MARVRFVTSLLSVIAPVRCSGCGRADTALYSSCTHPLSTEPVRELPSCRIAGNSISLVSWGINAGARRQAILDFRNGGQRRFARILMRSVAHKFVSTAGEHSSNVVVVPVPSSLRGGWNRGYSPSLLLSREIARHIHNARVVPLVVPGFRIVVVMRSRFTPRSRAVRLLRTAADYRVRAWPRDAEVVVVDDVSVTGSSVRAVCGALVSAGFRCRLPVVAAHVPAV